MIADTLYHRFAKDLRKFEDNFAPTVFKKFIDVPGMVVYDGNKCLIKKERKRGHTPALLGVEKLKSSFHVPWLNGKSIEIIWTA